MYSGLELVPAGVFVSIRSGTGQLTSCPAVGVGELDVAQFEPVGPAVGWVAWSADGAGAVPLLVAAQSWRKNVFAVPVSIPAVHGPVVPLPVWQVVAGLASGLPVDCPFWTDPAGAACGSASTLETNTGLGCRSCDTPFTTWVIVTATMTRL